MNMEMVFLAIVILLRVFCGVESVDVEGTEGSPVTIKCSHSDAFTNAKYFCKNPCNYADVLINTEGKKMVSKGKYSIEDYGNTFFVTINKLIKSDSGRYWCGIQRSGVDTYNEVFLSVLDAPTTTTTTITDASTTAVVSSMSSLRLSPDRSQFFKNESVFLSCEDRLSDSTVWRLKRTNTQDITSECGRDGSGDRWGRRVNNTGCLVSSMLLYFDSGVYWCESSKGKSNTVNMTVTAGAVILVMPVLPVMEGSDVTLRCWYRTKTTTKPSSGRPADFYKDGSLIGTESTGQITIHSVYKSGEGLYKCNVSGLGESPQSWMHVTDNNHPDTPYFYFALISVGISIFLLILGLCLWKKCKDPCCVKPIQPQGTNQDDMYCPLRHGNTSVYEVLDRSHHVPKVTDSSRPQRTADALYANVRNIKEST